MSRRKIAKGKSLSQFKCNLRESLVKASLGVLLVCSMFPGNWGW